jgi:hypothetical protein
MRAEPCRECFHTDLQTLMKRRSSKFCLACMIYPNHTALCGHVEQAGNRVQQPPSLADLALNGNQISCCVVWILDLLSFQMLPSRGTSMFVFFIRSTMTLITLVTKSELRPSSLHKTLLLSAHNPFEACFKWIHGVCHGDCDVLVTLPAPAISVHTGYKIFKIAMISCCCQMFQCFKPTGLKHP